MVAEANTVFTKLLNSQSFKVAGILLPKNNEP